MPHSFLVAFLEVPISCERWLAQARQLPTCGFWIALCLACACACNGSIDDGPQLAASAAGSSSAVAGTSSSSDAGNRTAGAAGTIGAAGAPAADGGLSPDAGATGSDRLPARLRRLTNAEFDNSVRALLGFDSSFGASFTPDTRQGGFTRNDAQRVDPVFVTQLNDAATKLAAMAKQQVNAIAPCADAAGNENCARTFIASFAQRAYRRPATTREVDALVAVYRVGSEGGAYADGIEAVVSAVLQSPGFIYTSELGAQPGSGDTRLTDYEIASAMAYLLTGAPPDDPLLQAASTGMLAKPEVRRTHAQRLLATHAAAKQVVRMVHEWLGIDRITETAKDSNVYPEFAGLRDAMKREADEFVSEVMWKTGSDVRELMAADWTPAEDNLARMYLNGQPPMRSGDHVSLASVRRRGILNQGAFLSVYAHATETAPVLRGVAVLRRVACIDIPSPTSLNLNVVPPVPDPAKTTRERFTVHSEDDACKSCHGSIDALGFTFEALDGMGRARTMENNRPVDSKTSLTAGYSFDGNYADSAELALRLADSKELRTCFARQVFRYAAARSDAAAKGAEASFMSTVAALPAGAQGKFGELMVAFIASDGFVQRGVSP
jgi:Protein of unknown function (DUF1592)/Protein of unknown function (DUF1588)/Protein of unknown function (DUF1595)/Protein of unknown function (DUF1587)